MKRGTVFGLGLAAMAFISSAPVTAQTGCAGDCDASGEVTVDEIVRAVNIALGALAVDQCPAIDFTRDGEVTIDEILAAVNLAIGGCASNVTPTAPAATPTATATATATPSPELDPQNPPASAQALRQWLLAGVYKSWHAESAAHASGGPHGGRVRTYLNDAVFESLQAGNQQHPRGAAVVKELYFNSDQVQEYAVEIKLEDSSNGGSNWYWYEGVGLAGRGLGICTGCHGGNYRTYVSKDFVLTPFPLQ